MLPGLNAFYICMFSLTLQHFSGAVGSTSDYESAGPSSIPNENRRRTVHPAVHPPKPVGRQIGKPGEGKLESQMSQRPHIQA